MCLFHFSTCFEQLSAHRQENQLYQLYHCVCGHLVCRSERSSLTCITDGHQHRAIYTRKCIDTIDSPDDEHWVARNMYRSEIHTLKKCVKLLVNTNCRKFFGFHSDAFSVSVCLGYDTVSMSDLCPKYLRQYSCKYNLQDAALYNILYYCQCSTCFGRIFRPSSGAQKLHTQQRVCAKLACCYR